MRIAFCTDVFAPHVGGTESVMLALCEEYMNKGHSVAVFTQDRMCDNSEYDRKQKYPIYRTKSYKLPLYPMCPHPKTDRNIKKLMVEFCPDVVHSHTPFEMGRWGAHMAKLLHIPSVLTTHTYLSFINNQNAPFSDKNPLHRVLSYIPSVYPKHTAALYTVNTGVSKYVIQKELRDVYRFSGPVILIKNGYKSKKLLFDPTNYYKQNHDKAAISLLYAGHIVEEKNIVFSLRVCKKLKEMNVPFTFTLAGDGQIPYFETKAKELGVENNVKFVGIKTSDELNYLYSSSDIFLFPSIFDCDSIACIESRHCGCPTLCIKNTGTSERVIDEQNGWALDDDIDAFAEKISQLYGLKTDSLPSFIKMREIVQACHIPSWSEIADKYINLYSQLISKV